MVAPDHPGKKECLKDEIARVMKSKQYLEFSKKHPHSYLAHAFTSRAQGKQEHWQLGFYDKETDKVTLFEIHQDNIVEYPAQEVYKEPGHIIEALQLPDINVCIDEALGMIEARMKESYKGEVSGKEIIILQNLKEYGTIWNITVLSLTFHVINFKINVTTGKILYEQRESLTTWKKED